MIENCKFCEEKVNLLNVNLIQEEWACSYCLQYSVRLLSNGIVESEILRSGNFYMVYIPHYKTASIVSTEDNDKKIINSFDMNELTHEQAVQWVKKLKTYSIFQ